MPEQGPILDPSMALVVRADHGDTFTSIAEQFGCDEDALRALNRDHKTVSTGDELLVPVRVTQVRSEDGDTLESIAEQFGTTLAELRESNPDVDTLTPGTILTIP